MYICTHPLPPACRPERVWRPNPCPPLGLSALLCSFPVEQSPPLGLNVGVLSFAQGSPNPPWFERTVPFLSSGAGLPWLPLVLNALSCSFPFPQGSHCTYNFGTPGFYLLLCPERTILFRFRCTGLGRHLQLLGQGLAPAAQGLHQVQRADTGRGFQPRRLYLRLRGELRLVKGRRALQPKDQPPAAAPGARGGDQEPQQPKEELWALGARGYSAGELDRGRARELACAGELACGLWEEVS